jgi:hypothetical protein
MNDGELAQTFRSQISLVQDVQIALSASAMCLTSAKAVRSSGGVALPQSDCWPEYLATNQREQKHRCEHLAEADIKKQRRNR